jgi:hypothetical protein
MSPLRTFQNFVEAQRSQARPERCHPFVIRQSAPVAVDGIAHGAELHQAERPTVEPRALLGEQYG